MATGDYDRMTKSELVAELEALRNPDAHFQLSLSEAKYRALVEGSSDFIYVLDIDGCLTYERVERPCHQGRLLYLRIATADK